MMYMSFQENSASTTDDELWLRYRVEDAATSQGAFSGNLWIGLDTDLNGDLDIFLMLVGKSGSYTLRAYSPGDGLNTAPNNSSIDVPVNFQTALASNSTFRFDLVTDIDGTGVTQLGDAQKPDYFTSFVVDFDEFVSLAAAKGVSMNKNTPLRFVAASATQDNSLNGDKGGYGKLDSDSTPYSTQGAFSPTMPLANPEVAQAPAPTALAFSTAERTITSGGTSDLITVQLRSSSGSPTATAFPVTVSLGNSTGVTFKDSTGGTAITSVTVPGGQQTASFRATATAGGTHVITASASGLSSAQQNFMVTGGAPVPHHITLTGPASVTAGQDSSNFTLTVVDSGGAAAAVAQNTTFTLNSTDGATATFTPTSVTVPSGASSTTFTYRNTKSGTKAIAAAWASGGTTLGNATANITVNAAAASQLVFTTTAQTISAGSTSGPITVELRDTYGNPVTTGGTVSLSAPGVTFWDTGDTNTITSVSVPNGQSTATFKATATTVGSPLITATSTGLSATQTLTVNAGAPAKIVFTTPDRSIAAGALSDLITVQLQDAYNNVATSSGGTVISLSGATFRDTGDSTTITTVTVPDSASTASFRATWATPGTRSLSASATGLTGASQNLTVGAGAPASITLTGPGSVTAGQASSNFTLTVRDASGTTTTVPQDTIFTLNSNSTGTVTFTPTQVTVASGASSATFTYTDTKAGAKTVTATWSSGGSTLGNAQAGITVNAAAASQLVFTTTAQTIAVGTTSGNITVELRDPYGNPVTTGATLDLSGTGVTFRDTTDSTNITQVTIPGGQSTASFKARAAVGSYTMTAQTGAISAQQALTVTAGAPGAVAFTTAPQTITAGGVTAPITVELRDGSGNPATSSGGTTVTLSAPGVTFRDTGNTTTITSVTVPDGQSTASFMATSTTAGTPLITAAATGLTSDTQTLTVNAGAAAKIVFSTPDRSIAAGATSDTITVQLQDAYSNVATSNGGTVINLSGATFRDTGNTTTITTVTVPDGASGASFRATSVTPGTHSLSASATGLTGASQNLAVGSGSPASITLTGPTSVTAGQTSTNFTLTVRDGLGNITNVSQATTFTLTSTTPASASFTPATVTVPSGSSSVTFTYGDVVAGAKTVTAAWASGGSNLGSATHGITVNAAAAYELRFTTPARTVAAGATSDPITVQLRDYYGNPVNGAPTIVSLTSTEAALSFVIPGGGPLTIPANQSTASFQVVPATVGNWTITASAGGALTDTQGLTVTAAEPTKILFTTPARTTTAGISSNVITVRLYDTYNNVANATAPTVISLSNATGVTFRNEADTADITSVTVAAGQSSANFKAVSTLAQVHTLAASNAGLGSVTQDLTVAAGAPAVIVFTTPDRTATPGAVSGVITVQLRDSYGNAASGGPTTINLSNATGVTFRNEANTADINSVTVATGESTASFKAKASTVQSHQLSASGTGLTSAFQNLVVQAGAPAGITLTGPSTVTAGVASGTFTLTVVDSVGAPANVTQDTAFALSSTAVGTATFAPGATVTVPSGSASVTFTYTDTRASASAKTISAAWSSGGSNLGSATHTITVNAGAPARLAFTTPAHAITAGATSDLITVQLQDSYSNPATAAGPTVISLSNGTGVTFRNEANTGNITGVTVASGESSANLKATATLAGNHTLTATSGSLTSANQPLTVNAGAPAKIAFTTPDRTATPGAASDVITVQLRDAYNNVATSGAPVTISLSNASGVTFRNEANTADINSVTVATGESAANFKARASAVQTHVLSASGTGLTGATQNFTVQAGAAAGIALTGPNSVTAGQTSTNFTLTVKDGLGNPTNVSQNTTFTLTSTTPASASFTPATVTVPSGSSSVTFTYSDSVAGAKTVTAAWASGGSNLGSATHGITVNAAAAYALRFTTPAPTVAAGATSDLITVQLRDYYGNPVNGAPTNVSLTSTEAALSFVIPGGGPLTLPANQSTASFRVVPATAGNWTITADAGGVLTDTQGLTVTAGAVSQIIFTTAARTTQAGIASDTITVQLRDANNNVVTVGSNTELSLSGATFRNTTDTANITTVTVPAGGSTASFKATATSTGIRSLTAALGPVSATQNLTVTPGLPAAFTLTGPGSVTAGQPSSNFTLTVKDAWDTTTTVARDTTFTLSSNSTGAYSFSPAMVTVTAGSSTATFTYSDPKANPTPKTLTANWLSGDTNLGSAQASITVNASAASNLAFITPERTTRAGVASGNITVELRDANDNVATAASDTEITLSGATFRDAADTTTITTVKVLAGESTVSFKATASSVGVRELTAATGAISAKQNLTITPGPAAAFTLTGPASVKAGEASGNFTLTVMDAFGTTTTADQATTFALTSNSTGTTSFSPATVTLASGASSATFTYTDAAAGVTPKTVTAIWWSGGTNLGTATHLIKVNGEPTAEDQTPGAEQDRSITLTLKATDPDSSSLIFTVPGTTQHGTLTKLSGACSGSGPYTCTETYRYTPATRYSGTDSFTFSVTDVTYTDEGTVDLTVAANRQPSLAFQTIHTVNQGATLTFTAVGSDPDGDPITYSFDGDSRGATVNESGNVSWTPAKDLAPDTYKFTLQVSDDRGGSRTVEFDVTVFLAPSLSLSTVTASPTSIEANGTTTSTITVQLRDATGVLTDYYGPVTLTTTAATSTITPNATFGNGVYTGTLTSRTTAGPATVKAYLHGQLLENTATVNMILGTVKGKVVSDTGRAAALVPVDIAPVGGATLRSVTTDQNGEYQFAGLLHGDYTVTVPSSDPQRPNATGPATVTAGEEYRLDLTVTTRATLTLTANPTTIVGNGKALSHLTATLAYVNGSGGVTGVPVDFESTVGQIAVNRVNTNAQGQASTNLKAPTLSGVEILTEWIKVYAHDFRLGIFAETKLQVTFKPPTIAGVVADAEGRPVAGATVTIREDFDKDGDVDFEETVTTGADGKYEILVPRGDYDYTTRIRKQVTVNGATFTVDSSQTGSVGDAGNGERVEASRTIGGLVLIKDKTAQAPRQPTAAEQITGRIIAKDGAPMNQAFTVNPDGSYRIDGVQNGTYRLVFQYDNRLAGVAVAAVVADGQLSIQTPLIDPFGVVSNSSGQPVSGVLMRLYWADTTLNRTNGRQPHSLVVLPPLAGFDPADNAVPQYTNATGNYAWMVFPNGDYYITASKDGYGFYDSRSESRNVAALPGEDSYVTNGIIHVGTAIVRFDMTLPDYVPAPPPVRPNPPINLTATPEQGKINLTWTAVPGATSYKLYRADSPNGPFVELAAGLTTTTYADPTGVAGRTYYYYVTAIGAGGESTPSAKANATLPTPPVTPVTPPAPKLPEAPANLEATPGEKQVDLIWTPSTGADCYTIYRGVTSGGPYTAIATCVPGTTYTDTDVQHGSTYYYIVAAVSKNGSSPFTPQKQAALKPPAPAPVPQMHKRYIMGYPNGTFGPERSITRAEVATILARVTEADLNLVSAAAYPDVATTHWATKYIAATTKLGLMKGDPDGKFRPEDPISRQEVATIAVRFKGLLPVEGLAFADTAGQWGAGYVKAAFDARLMQGYPNGTFEPRKPISRAEFVTVINRLLSRGPLHDRPAVRWPDVSPAHWAYGQVQEASIGHDYLPHATLTGEAWVKDRE